MGRTTQKSSLVPGTLAKRKIPKIFFNYSVFVPDKANALGLRQIQIVAETSYGKVAIDFAKAMSKACAEYVDNINFGNEGSSRRVMGFNPKEFDNEPKST